MESAVDDDDDLEGDGEDDDDLDEDGDLTPKRIVGVKKVRKPASQTGIEESLLDEAGALDDRLDDVGSAAGSATGSRTCCVQDME